MLTCRATVSPARRSDRAVTRQERSGRSSRVTRNQGGGFRVTWCSRLRIASGTGWPRFPRRAVLTKSGTRAETLAREQQKQTSLPSGLSKQMRQPAGGGWGVSGCAEGPPRGRYTQSRPGLTHGLLRVLEMLAGRERNAALT